MKHNWFCVGSFVEHRKTGKIGMVMELRGSLNRKDQKYRIRWKNGREEWVVKKYLRRSDER